MPGISEFALFSGCAAGLAELAFLLEQGALAFDAPAVAAQALVRPDDAVAGNHQRDRVSGAGIGHGAAGAGLADGGGDLAVAARLAGGNGLQFAPDLQLKGGRAQVQRQIDIRLPAFQVGDNPPRPEAKAIVIAQALGSGEFRGQIVNQRPRLDPPG